MLIKNKQDWEKSISFYKKSLKRKTLNFKETQYLGSNKQQLQRRNSFYLRQLKHRATKAELEFGFLLCRFSKPFIFQKGFFNKFHRIADFYLPKYKIIFEIDGGYHKDIQKKDKLKDISIQKLYGIKTYRFLNEEVLENPEYVISKLTILII